MARSTHAARVRPRANARDLSETPSRTPAQPGRSGFAEPLDEQLQVCVGSRKYRVCEEPAPSASEVSDSPEQKTGDGDYQGYQSKEVAGPSMVNRHGTKIVVAWKQVLPIVAALREHDLDGEEIIKQLIETHPELREMAKPGTVMDELVGIMKTRLYAAESAGRNLSSRRSTQPDPQGNRQRRQLARQKKLRAALMQPLVIQDLRKLCRESFGWSHADLAELIVGCPGIRRHPELRGIHPDEIAHAVKARRLRRKGEKKDAENTSDASKEMEGSDGE